MQHLQIGGRVYDLQPFFLGSNTKVASDRPAVIRMCHSPTLLCVYI